MNRITLTCLLLLTVAANGVVCGQPPARTAGDDGLRVLQAEAVREGHADWGHWGNDPDRYSDWTNHSNRLVPVYTFGITLDTWRRAGSAYGDADRLKSLYGRVPEATLNPTASYHDQTDIYRLQQAAVDAGFRHIVLIVFDGMDWQTTRAAAVCRAGEVAYRRGRGRGLSFLDYRGTSTDFGLVVTSPRRGGAKTEVDAQLVLGGDGETTGGYNPIRGGREPWHETPRGGYLLGADRRGGHAVTDSAASATSLASGIKTYNGAINVAVDGTPVEPIGRRLQRERSFQIGVVSSVPLSHATPAAAYANNVSRKDYQDITRDLLGLPSSAHRNDPLTGVDVLIGAGWGVQRDSDGGQGKNFLAGNRYLHRDDLRRSDVDGGGRYVVAERTSGRSGREMLFEAADRAARRGHRLLGFFGTRDAHLPYQTADGGYDPTRDVRDAERVSEADVTENPTLAEMTEAALKVLERSGEGFWLLVEAGDVDWANHANNIDNSVGAVFSGADAFDVVTDWAERNEAWDTTAVIVTADHGHYLVIKDAGRIAGARR